MIYGIERLTRKLVSTPISLSRYSGLIHVLERTKMRPLASGEIVPLQALSFLGIQLSVGLAVLTQLNLYSFVSSLYLDCSF